MSEIFQEVEEEYRRQELAKFWTKYRIPIIAGAVILIGAVAGYQAWRYWYDGRLEHSSREFSSILKSLESVSDPKDVVAANERLNKLAKEATGGYSALARFQIAAQLLARGMTSEAVTAYDSIASTGGEPLFVDYAKLRAALILLNSASFTDLSSRIGVVANSSGPWKWAGKELLGFVYWREGKNSDAIKLYNEIENADAAEETMKRRASEMRSLIESGLKFADIKKSIFLQSPPPQSTTSPLLLPPAAQPNSLLGPDIPIPELPTPSTPPSP